LLLEWTCQRLRMLCVQRIEQKVFLMGLLQSVPGPSIFVEIYAYASILDMHLSIP
jgi:hypothetical protein